ncbi:hypothetical protein BC827DRAFT_1184685, partial [Russula dissimulans]
MQTPIWNILVCMLLTEARHIEDGALPAKCRLGIPAPPLPPAASPVPLGCMTLSHSGLAVTVYPREYSCFGLEAVHQTNKKDHPPQRSPLLRLRAPKRVTKRIVPSCN